MLTLPIKREWFEMIKSGKKREEYRELNPYYTSRFAHLGNSGYVLFRAGYSSSSPTLEAFVNVKCGVGRPEWGAVPNRPYFILEIISFKVIQGCSF